jgi:DNA-binding NtrC family response regulator
VLNTSKGRTVACLSCGPCDQAVLRCLQQAGWVTEQVDVLDESTEPAVGAETRVALLRIASVDHDKLSKLASLAHRWRDLELVAVVGPGVIDDEACREFIAVHCADYQTLPIDCERLLFSIGHVEGMATLAHQVRDLSLRAKESADIIGSSPVMQDLKRDVEKIAQVDAPVIIAGESGTGKELFAQSIHRFSNRRQHPFVAVNCVSLSPSLIHAELFGHERGAFTGAEKRQVGHLEAAHRGTILLDEIGDLAPELQILLLRFLEQKTIRRVGGREEIALDVRVIAATHVDLDAAVSTGRFREDLYYRLNVLRLQVPPLRDRREDIPELADAFLERFRSEHHGHLRGFSGQALRAMQSYDWPGNVRELMNRVRRAIVMATGHEISVEDLQLAPRRAGSEILTLETARNEAERHAVLGAMSQCGGDVTRGSELLGVSRATMYRLLGRHDLLQSERPAGGPSEAERRQLLVEQTAGNS